MEVAGSTNGSGVIPPAPKQEQEPLLKGTENDKALAAGFASVSEAFAAKLRGTKTPPSLFNGDLKDLGLDATFHELVKLRDELLTAAQRLRTSTWASVSEGIHLKDLQRAAEAERSKVIKLANEKNNKPVSTGGDFLKKQYIDTQRQIEAAKHAPAKLAVKKAELQKERVTLIKEKKRVIAERKAADQRRRRIVVTMNQLLADHGPGGTKEVKRLETEAELLAKIDSFPQWRLDQFQHAKTARHLEDQRLAAGWSREKIDLQEEMVRKDEERGRWMMQAEELRELLRAAPAARPPQSQSTLMSLIELLQQTKHWEQKEEEEKAHLAELRAALRRHESKSRKISKESVEAGQNLRSELAAAEQEHARKQVLWRQIRGMGQEDSVAESNGPKDASISSNCSVSSLHQAASDSAPKESFYLDVRQALVRNGAKGYLQSLELQEIFKENERLEQEYKETLQRKNEEEAAVHKELQDVLDEPARLQSELDKVLEEVHGMNNALKTLRKKIMKLAFDGKIISMVHAAKHIAQRRTLDEKERILGAVASGVIVANAQRAEVAAEQLEILSEREPIVEKRLKSKKKLAAQLSQKFDEVHAVTMYEVNRLVRFMDRGAVTLLLQAVDQHVMNIEQHAAERDINAQFKSIMQAAQA
eukprot:gnl/MRDRNA2_/MRDRNA2_107172_c0_seq1.p1 gnl/MRDRNA2_/MRDRNA2_107172_c0~~gnl/MRDRNA2_/MRDRNA2_107172_c0_seq1.p1  ORF type:complete len:646 (-),score=204.04 gnl/MRDRNA2_/MRDRNA2_107172_c0_seq1:85-2022(-)